MEIAFRMIFFPTDDIDSQSESDFKELKHIKLQKTRLQPVLVINRALSCVGIAFILGLSRPFLSYLTIYSHSSLH